MDGWIDDWMDDRSSLPFRGQTGRKEPKKEGRGPFVWSAALLDLVGSDSVLRRLG